MRVSLIVKLADVVDGIDLSQCAEGDVIDLAEDEARLLIAEKWAEAVDEPASAASFPAWVDEREIAADTGVPVRPDISAAPETPSLSTDDLPAGPFTDATAYRP